MRVTQDLRAAVFTLARTPGATAVALLSLALGMGANTAIFSLLNALVLRPLPVAHPEQLVALATTIADNVNGDEPFTLQMFDEMSRRQKVFSDLFAWNSNAIENFEAEGRQFTAAPADVSGNYFQTMQLAPLLGRFIGPGDVAMKSGTSDAVAVISYRAWREWYHGDSQIIGKTIRLARQPYTIVGVEPPGFFGLIIDGAPDVTVPLFAPGRLAQRDPKMLWLRVYGRLKPGITVRQARASFRVLWPRILEATRPPGYEGQRRARFFARRMTLESAATGVSFLRKRFSYSLGVLLALVGTVLLMACLNLANLSLAKAARRRHEAGVRAALGAGTWDLVRQPLTEAFLLSFGGALLGLAMAYWTSQALLHVAWTGMVAIPLSTAPDGRVLLFTGAVAILTGVLFATVPAWYAARTDPLEALGQRTRSVHGGANFLGKALVAAQIALSLVLLVGALLFGQTLARLHTADVGYKRDHWLTLLLFPQSNSGKQIDSNAYYQALVEKLQNLPGVAGVSYSHNGPANEMEDRRAVYRSLKSEEVQAASEVVGPKFFAVAGMRVISGREFTWHDDEHAPGVAVISESLAKRLYGNDNPVGRDVYFGPRPYQQQLRVIGVVNSASLWKVESYQPMAIYRTLSQNLDYRAQPLLDVRTTANPRSMKATIDRAVRSLGHHYSLRTVTVEERLDSYITVQRLTALLTGFFGGVALLIAAAGLYGLTSFQVAQRTAEVGIRIALGARRGQVLSLVLQEVMLLAALGCALGFAASLAVRKLVAGLLFGVSASDPVLLGLAVCTLMLMAAAAGFLPARRAAGVDPMTALRAE